MEKVALYCRVSGQEQGKKETIQTQLAKLKEKYKKEKIIKEYKDICSGAYLQREGLNQLREDAKKKLFDVIGIYALDRLSRNLGHQIALLEEFEKQEIKVEVLGENYEDSPEGMLNRNIRGAFSEYERYKIATRMRDGKYRKAEAGKLVASYPTFGYKLTRIDNEAHFEIDPKESKIVKSIFGMYLETHSQRGVGKKLKEMGIVGRGRRNQKPAPLNYRMLSGLLRNETYIGNFYFGRSYFVEPERRYKTDTKTLLTRRKFRPRSEWKLIKVPAIIDKSIFDRVQEILKVKAINSLKPTKHQYLCQGLIKCVNCGRRYSGGIHNTYKGKDYLIYLCPQKYKRGVSWQSSCNSRSMNVEKLDGYIWQYIQALISQPEKVKRAINLLKEKRESDRSFNQKVYDSLIVEKAEIKKKKSRILDLYSEGNYQKEDLDSKISDLNSQEELFNQQIRNSEKNFEKIENTEVIEKEIEQLCLEYQDKIKNPNFELKKRIVRKWVKEINITNEANIVLKIRIPEPEEPLKLPFVSQTALI